MLSYSSVKWSSWSSNDHTCLFKFFTNFSNDFRGFWFLSRLYIWLLIGTSFALLTSNYSSHIKKKYLSPIPIFSLRKYFLSACLSALQRWYPIIYAQTCENIYTYMYVYYICKNICKHIYIYVDLYTSKSVYLRSTHCGGHKTWIDIYICIHICLLLWRHKNMDIFIYIIHPHLFTAAARHKTWIHTYII